MAQADELLTAREVAEMMNIAVDTVYSMRHAGRGPAGWRRGKRLLFRRSDVEIFLARERQTSLRGSGVTTA